MPVSIVCVRFVPPGPVMPSVVLEPDGKPLTVIASVPICGGGGGDVVVLKVAVTFCAVFIVTLHAPVPLHAPPQPAKLEPEAGVAVRLTIAPWLKFAAQVAPQLIPAGLLETVPAPEPALLTVSANCGALVVVKLEIGLVNVPSVVTNR